jgi:two-component system phosphate regulon sensor histidine kinase PhoR
MHMHEQFIGYATLQSLAEGIIVIDEEQVVQLINPAACRLLELKADAVLGNHFADLPFISDLKTTGQTIELGEKTKLPNGPYEHSWGIAFPNGRFLQFQTRPVIDSEHQLRIGTVIKIEETTLEYTARDMLLAMFNDIHTPLIMIKGYIDLLIQGVDQPLTERQHEMASIIRDKTTQLLALRQDVIEDYKRQADGNAGSTE